jgi:thioredoxin-like negative regulator of GroEL
MKAEVGSSGVLQGQAERSGTPVLPRLVFFYSPTSGSCRRTEAYLAHLFQRRGNHAAFQVLRVNVEDRPDLAARFRANSVPTLVVVENRRVVRRIVSPTSALELQRELGPWLQ